MKLTPLKRIVTKLRHLELSNVAKNVLLIVFSLLISDALVSVLVASYLSESTGPFMGKSRTVILSDLLFLEGAVIFAAGSFITFARTKLETKPSAESTTETNDNTEQTRDKQIHIGIQMMIAGAILIGLSMTVGTQFL